MDSPVQKIKERLGIEEVASSYIKLERAGANLKAKCPFHNEKTPSFFISPARGTYYCFGCGASGDIFSFVEEFEGLDFKGALKLLAVRAGVELKAYTQEMKEAESEKERLYRAMTAATVYYESNLKDNKTVLEYLKARGLNEESIKNFRIGFVPEEWRGLHAELRRQGFSDADIEKAGLTKKSDKGLPAGRQGYYDRFRGRIMFPIADSSGRVVAFSGRIFVDPSIHAEQAENQAKYVNSPETPIFHKSSVLYGIEKAKESIRKNNFSILVEGQMDLILSHQAGYRNTVASSGTALSDSAVSAENGVSNLGLVRRLSDNIVLAFDGDAAGEKAALRAGKIALALGMDVKVAALPEGSDPAELIATQGPGAWRDAIKNSTHVIEYVVTKILHAHAGDPRKAGRDIREKALPFIAALDSSIERAHFLKKVSDMSGIREDALEEDLRQAVGAEQSKRGTLPDTEAAQAALRRKDHIKRKLLGMILWQETLPAKAIDSAALLAELAGTLGVAAETLRDEAGQGKEDLIFEAEILYGAGGDPARDAAEMLVNLREEVFQEELSRKMRELYLAEEARDRDRAAEIFAECQLLSTKIQDIKNSRSQPPIKNKI